MRAWHYERPVPGPGTPESAEQVHDDFYFERSKAFVRGLSGTISQAPTLLWRLELELRWVENQATTRLGDR